MRTIHLRTMFFKENEKKNLSLLLFLGHFPPFPLSFSLSENILLMVYVKCFFLYLVGFLPLNCVMINLDLTQRHKNFKCKSRTTFSIFTVFWSLSLWSKKKLSKKKSPINFGTVLFSSRSFLGENKCKIHVCCVGLFFFSF